MSARLAAALSLIAVAGCAEAPPPPPAPAVAPTPAPTAAAPPVAAGVTAPPTSPDELSAVVHAARGPSVNVKLAVDPSSGKMAMLVLRPKP